MPPKPAKQVKKDSMPTENVATSDVSMEALTSLLESHKVSLSTEFKTVIAALESKIDLIHATISDHGQRITSLESNADLVDGRLSTLEATCAELAASNAKLRAKTADLEARSRRKNIRIIGLPASRLRVRDQPPSSPTYYPSFWGTKSCLLLLNWSGLTGR
ncbi:hypothetical protein KUCAC02_011504 [Chaenocephalus aceratus]|uniref:Uncharacterized protein n=1 Tax=Chaenocephalus aceratus TaxID=36190 RepID=A0ACB9WWM6_CHAAC|nr:hypothetical protein KUCAC02_011504 [Chaenocephalus aceratus]